MERLSISAPVTLMPFWYGVSSTSQATVRPVVVVVAAISSTTANRLVEVPLQAHRPSLSYVGHRGAQGLAIALAIHRDVLHIDIVPGG